MKRTPLLFLLALAAAGTAPGQPVVSSPDFDVSLVTAGVPATGDSMAVDRFGNVYVVDQPGPLSTTPPRIVKVAPNGTVTANHASGFGTVGQLATNPQDGLVYLVESSPLLPVILGNVWRIDPNGGATMLFSVDVVARGMTIANDGQWYFGGTGLNGQGLYRVLQPSGPGTNTTTFLGPGHGQNRVLQALVSNDVLIADAFSVLRWTPSTIGPLLYYQHPLIPNTQVTIGSIARSPFNELGAGAIIGVNELTFGISGLDLGVSGDLQQSANAPFITESYTSPSTGLRSLAAGCRQDLYWLTDVPVISPGPVPVNSKALFRIRTLPAAGVAGTLQASVTPSQLVIGLYGPPAGGDPFLLGFKPPISVASGAFFPVIGCVGVSPFDPAYVPFLDGIGLFGPANPFAVTPAGGHFQLAITLPPGLPPITVVSEALLLNSGAPNGIVYVSNTEGITVP